MNDTRKAESSYFFHRPSCSRCKALHTDCEYNAEAGESRWSALRRKSNMLERERDEARELVAALHSRTESEAQDIYNRVRSSTFSDDMGALIQEVRDATSPRPRLQQQLRPHQQHQDASLHQLDRQQQHAQQSQQMPQQQTMFSQSNLGPGHPAPGPQLPPLRSIVDMPPAGISDVSHPLPQQFPPLQQPIRHGSLTSGMSSGSYSSVSSSDGHSVSPREEALPNQGLFN